MQRCREYACIQININKREFFPNKGALIFFGRCSPQFLVTDPRKIVIQSSAKYAESEAHLVEHDLCQAGSESPASHAAGWLWLINLPPGGFLTMHQVLWRALVVELQTRGLKILASNGRNWFNSVPGIPFRRRLSYLKKICLC